MNELSRKHCTYVSVFAGAGWGGEGVEKRGGGEELGGDEEAGHIDTIFANYPVS